MTTLGAELPECAGSDSAGVTEGEGPPTSTPSALGDHYIDTLNGNAYVAVCTTGPVCWRQATGAGGGDLLAANNLSDVLSAVTSRLNLGLVIGVDVQAWTAVLQATTASYTAANATKLGGIEALADVTDAANVVPALAANTVNVDFNDVALLQVGPIEERIQTVAATGATETLDVSEYGWFDMTMDQASTSNSPGRSHPRSPPRSTGVTPHRPPTRHRRRSCSQPPTQEPPGSARRLVRRSGDRRQQTPRGRRSGRRGRSRC